MNETRYVLIFSGQESGIDAFGGVLRDVGLIPLFPQDLKDNIRLVSIVILDRPAANAISIYSNLKKQNTFRKIPILVLLDGADQAQISQLTALGADLFFKPVGSKALSRYLKTKIDIPIDRTGPPTVRFDSESERSNFGDNSAAKIPTQPEPTSVAGRVEVAPIENLIPASNRLLPAIMSPMQVGKGGVPCVQCGRWRVRREDSYCARCGATLASLAAPSEVVFEPFGEHCVGQLIELKNVGQNPLRMKFNLLTSSELEKRLSLHTTAANLEGNVAEHLLAIFDARGLDLSMRYQAVLDIACNVVGHSRQQVALVVDRLPKARIVADERYTYVLGARNQWEFRLANDGGGTLSLSSARFSSEDGSLTSNDTLLETSDPASVKAKGGQSTSFTVQAPELDFVPGQYVRSVSFEFEHCRPLSIELSIEVVRPARLTIQPTELDFGVVSARRSRRLSLQLVNVGGEELLIDSITPSVDWMFCPTPTPRTIPPGNASVVDIQVQGSIEALGSHEGLIRILSSSYQSAVQDVPFIVKLVDPLPYEDYIGIDFGTTASCVAILDKNDQPFVIPLDTIEVGYTGDSRIMPSVLYFQPDGVIIAGSEALKDADIQPANAVTSIKRVLGRKQKKWLAGREFDPTELTSKIIEQLIMRTEAALFQLGEYKTPRRAVVTVPVEIFDNQRRALLQACEMAGLEVHTSSTHGVVIDEAHAAALYYLSKNANERTFTSEPERLLIFDFGGGTLDCALLEIEIADEKVRLKTLAPGGDPHLGGEDIDWALAQLLAVKTKKEFPEFDINCLGDEQQFNHYFRVPEIARAAYSTRAHFKRQAEIAKITLSNATAVELSIGPLLRTGATPIDMFIMNGTGPWRFEVEISRQELESVIEPFLTRAARVVETLCQRAEVSPETVNTILHVGRTSYLPLIRERIKGLLPNAIDRSELIERKLCVALGAAFWGQIKDQPGASFEFIGGTDQLVHDVGYVRFSGSLLRQVFVTVFPAKTQFPCSKIVELPLNKDLINLQLAENRGKDDFIDDNPEIRKIGKVRFDTCEPSAPTIFVNFAIDENRVLEISANGQTQNIELMDE